MEINQLKTYPKISVITPSFNQGKFLEETILSVLSQNYPNLEYIIIDGGSTDQSVEIIKKFDKHLKYWVSEKDSGHSEALNKGFSQATGDILAWINSDDKYFPWTLHTVAEIFSQNSEIEWVTGLATVIDEHSRIYMAHPVRKDMNDFLVNNFGWIQQESTFWKKSLWDRAGGRITSNHKLMVDGELWARFFKYSKLWHVDLCLGAYRVHGVNRAIIYRKEVMEEMYSIVKDLRKYNGRFKLAIAYLCRILRKLHTGLRLFHINIHFYSFGSYNVIVRENDLWIPQVDAKLK